MVKSESVQEEFRRFVKDVSWVIHDMVFPGRPMPEHGGVRDAYSEIRRLVQLRDGTSPARELSQTTPREDQLEPWILVGID